MKDPEDLGAWFDALAEWDGGRDGLPSGPLDTVRYGEHPHQHFDVWTAGQSALPGGPVVVSIHGGYFLQEYDKSLHTAIVRQLAADGFTVANLEYRRDVMGRAATISDVNAALDEIVQRYRPSSIAVLGHSAGGYLAEVLARHQDVDLAIPLAPVSDLAQASREGWDDGGIALWMGGRPDEEPDAYRDADLRTAIAGDAKRVVIHGTADTAVGVEQSREFTRALRAAGVDVTYLELPGEGHFGYLDPREAAFGALSSELEKWSER